LAITFHCAFLCLPQSQDHQAVTFDDIASLDRAKELLNEAVALPLILPELFTGTLVADW
jgi:SpoVK/Ycf46/Vps4 family AAA+-type ATPase